MQTMIREPQIGARQMATFTTSGIQKNSLTTTGTLINIRKLMLYVMPDDDRLILGNVIDPLVGSFVLAALVFGLAIQRVFLDHRIVGLLGPETRMNRAVHQGDVMQSGNQR